MRCLLQAAALCFAWHRTSRQPTETSLRVAVCAGSIKDYLVDNPERHGTHTLVEVLNLKRRMNITIDATLCALLTALDIAEALKFMHKSKTLHGDLKPHNILLVSAVRPASAWLCCSVRIMSCPAQAFAHAPGSAAHCEV